MSKASDYEFCTFHNENGDVAVLIGPINDPEFDQEIGAEIRPFWPAGIIMNEVTESTFVVSEGLSEQEVRDELTNAGFVYSEEWQKDLDEQLGEDDSNAY